MEGTEVEARRSPVVGSRVPRLAELIQRARLHRVAARLVVARKADIVRPYLL
jgi:hypothetical protein